MVLNGGIGDYVHLRLESYRNGLAVHNTVYEETSQELQENKAIKAIYDQHSKLCSVIDNMGDTTLAQKVEKKLNNIFNDNRNEKDQEKYEAMIDAAAQNTGLDANLVTLLLSEADSVKVSRQFSRWQLSKKANETMEAMRQIKDILNNLNRRIISADKNNKGVRADVQAKLQGVININDMNILEKDVETGDNKLIAIFNEKLGEVKKAVGEILGITSESTKTLNKAPIGKRKIKEWTPIKEVRGATENGKGSITIEIGDELFTIPQDKITNALAAINKYINAIAITTKIIGDTAEYGLGGLACFLMRTEENMPLYVLGGERGLVTYDTSKFTYFDAQGKPISLLYNKDTQSALFKDFSMFEQNSNKYLHIASAPSQNKVDVKFTSDVLQKLLDDEEGKITQNMNMSVKAYKRSTAKSKGFGGVSESSFLYLIQDEMPEFVNHWINLTIAHEGGDKFSETSTEVKQAHRVMRQTLIVIGAIGGTLKTADSEVKHTSQADYLVWKDTTRSQNSWHVYAMSTVLKPILNNTNPLAFNKYVEGYNDLINSSGWETSRITGNKEASITQRLQEILLLLHQRKITTHTPMPNLTADAVNI